MPLNRPKGRGGGGACPSHSLRGMAKGRRGRLVATYELPVHWEGQFNAFSHARNTARPISRLP